MLSPTAQKHACYEAVGDHAVPFVQHVDHAHYVLGSDRLAVLLPARRMAMWALV
jgi:hypothetical protein